MEVILLENIRKLGGLGDKVKVKPGYARNFLLPTAKAVLATEENITAFEAKRAELEAQHTATLDAASKRVEKLTELRVTIESKAGEGGRLFGSVGAQDIADAIRAAGVEVAKSEVRLGDGPLRQVGEHAVSLHLHADVDAEVTVEVVAEA